MSKRYDNSTARYEGRWKGRGGLISRRKWQDLRRTNARALRRRGYLFFKGGTLLTYKHVPEPGVPRPAATYRAARRNALKRQSAPLRVIQA